jgi:hypothetical protein
MAKFKAKVTSFPQASANFASINKYLTAISRKLVNVDWNAVPKKKRKKRGGPYDEGAGAKGGKWPP